MRILITASFHKEGLTILRKHAKLVVEDWRQTGKVYWGEELLEKIQAVKADAIIVEADAVTDDVIEGVDLKFIGSTRDKPKEVDVEAATAKQVPVLYAPGRNADSVADLTILLMLAQARKLVQIDRQLKSGNVQVSDAEQLATMQESLKGSELGRSTIGIVGLGQIGWRVAERLSGFGARVIYYDPFVQPTQDWELQAEPVSLEQLMKTSDFVTIHVPATPETFRMIGKDQIAMMKPTAHLINTARSAVIDEDALFEAVQSGAIAGAGLDVHSREPVGSDNRFLAFDNVTVTPHIGGNTSDVVYRQSLMVATDVDRLLTGKRPHHIINPEVLKSS
ncbi:MAG: NAD(P)-dependent oxidoreductase [Promethearchaeota archaeon]